MDNPFLQQAAEWFERGRHDIEMAQLLFNEKGYTDTIAFLIQQGAEKYLKGFLVFHGRRIDKAYRTHDLGFLLGSLEDVEPEIAQFADFCDRATRYYIEDRYPPGPPVQYSVEEIEQSLVEAQGLSGFIKKKSEVE